MTDPAAKSKTRGGLRVGQGSPGDALTLAYLPLGLLIVILLAGLFAFAFRLGVTPPLISIGLWAVLIVAVGAATRQLSVTAAAGTRLTLAHIALVCLLAGVAAAPPPDVPPLMAWSLAAIGAAAAAIIAVEAWITEKIDAAGPFSRHLGNQAYGLLILALAVLLWRSGKVGGWVTLAGAVHYAHLAASLALPALRALTPAPWRPLLRLAVAAGLAAALAPTVPPGAAAGLGLAAIVGALAGPGADINRMRTQKHNNYS